MSFLDIILALTLVMFLVQSRTIADGAIFERDSTAALRGVVMIGIILHHIHNRLGFDSPVLKQMGDIANGFFFFVSGYGNTLSVNKRDTIDIKWFIKKYLKILVPFLAAYCIFFLGIALLFPSEVPNKKELIWDILTISLPNQVSWFPKIIVLCFLVQYVAKKIFRKPMMQFLAISAVLCGYVVLMIGFRMGLFWYASVLCYPFGVFVSLNRDKLVTYLSTRKRRMLFLDSSIVAFGVLFVATNRFWLVQPFCDFAFCTMCFLYTSAFRVRSRLMGWIGNNSFEYYLFHMACLDISRIFISKNFYLYTLCVFLGSSALVFLYLQIKKIIIGIESVA